MAYILSSVALWVMQFSIAVFAICLDFKANRKNYKSHAKEYERGVVFELSLHTNTT